ncbi:MAG: hypothetical protein KQ78_01994 [Candidatus Izimaplasma bacterium HR2]|nr:MAG: hypothetical protein KQ78_01994 [Candidatus Izimaplasma bacterium HR2]
MFNTIGVKRAMLKNDKGQYYSFLTERFADFNQEIMETFITIKQEIKDMMNLINFLVSTENKRSSKKHAQKMVDDGLHIVYVNLLISMMAEG